MIRSIALPRVWVACPVCGSDDAVTVLREIVGDAHRVYARECPLDVQGGEALVRCRCCGMAYINPQPRLPANLASYPPSEETAYFAATRQERVGGAEHLLALLEQRLGSRGRLFDIGCGDGALLSVALERGWQADGIEASASLVAQLDANGLVEHVQLGRAEALAGDDARYDAVVLLNVLEHTLEPAAVLGEAVRVLRSGGLLAVHVPNYAWGRLWGRRWHQLQPLEHKHYFAPRTLHRLLVRVGLMPLARFGLPPASPARARLQRFLAAFGLWPGSGLGMLATRRR